MDTLNPKFNKDESSFKTGETETSQKMPIPGSFLDFFRSIQSSVPPVSSAIKAVPEKASYKPAPYYEPAPLYKGTYDNLCPLNFNTSPVDDASNTKLDRNNFKSYNRAQLFFLLRLERFLRLRKYWLDASPREDESWKTNLILRGVLSALNDCQKHDVGVVGMKLVKDWGCC